jgi:acetoacetyl-CoA synthetase
MKPEDTPPTLDALTVLLGQGPGSLVPLKAQCQSPPAFNPPIFMAHGLGDTVLGLFQLARHMQVSHPIYGMQARGLDGDEPLDRIEDMAEYHLPAIRQLQPHGPYALIGYSFGGLVTLEIARRLSRDGEKITLLAMLDSYPDRRQLSFGQHARLVLRLAMARAASFVGARTHRHRPPDEGRTRNAPDQTHLDEATLRALQRMKECQYRALRNYRLQFYGGKIYFVKAAISSFFPSNPAAVWAPLAGHFEIETVPGHHLEMLTLGVGNLASVLSRRLRKALNQQHE